jgi:hypothetical protein
MTRLSAILVVSVAAAAGAVLLLCGCGGDDVQDFNRILTGVVVEDSFVVAAGETVGFRGDVTIQAQTATIDGQLIAEASSGSGAPGASLTIEAEQDIVVRGQIAAGQGTGGATNADGGKGGAANADGGKGGGVKLSSANGNVTLGEGAAPAARRARQARGASLQSGNGGDGGDGTLGGAGGNGGDITIECPNGTWHITPGPDLLVFGNGGNGGNGNVPTAQLASITIPQTLPNAGGDAGRLLGHLGGIDGVPLTDGTDPQTNEPIKLAELGEGAVAGWDGGDAGTSAFGADTATSQQPPRVRTSGKVGAVEVVGSKGGDGNFRGGSGASVQYGADAADSGTRGADVSVIGGKGGAADWHRQSLVVQVGEILAGVFTFTYYEASYRGGAGGNAVARGGAGGEGAPGQNGSAGGSATARGGDGGVVDYPISSPDYLFGGRGGSADATGGWGGNGGAGTATWPGGAGGSGGDATAIGGNGSDIFPWAERNGAGGNATALGGRGGNGADGAPPGVGGKGGTATATGGRYNPVGTATQKDGTGGAAGKFIEPPPTTTRRYGVVETAYHAYEAAVLRNWYSWTGQLFPESAHTSQLPVAAYVFPGENAYVNAARTRLWLGTEVHAQRIDDPLGAANQGPVFVADYNGGTRVGAIWVDESRDLLYCLPWWSLWVYVYENASTATTNQNPTRRIQVILDSPATGLTGDGARDRLFVRTNNPGNQATVAVVDNASTRSGDVTPDRLITNLPTAGDRGRGIAYARQQDMLYLSLPEAVGRIGSASTRNGPATPTLLQGVATGLTDEPASLEAFGDTDVLFVAVDRGALLVFDHASTLSGNVAFKKSDASRSQLIGVAAFVEPTTAATRHVARR